MPIDYSFLTTPPMCPACPTSECQAQFENLVYWTLGYGGWTGIAFLPIVWSLSVSKGVRAILSVLVIPTTAFVITASFTGFYLFSQFLYKISAIMVSAKFIHSSLAIICVSVGSLGAYLASSKRLEIVVQTNAEVEENESGSSVGSAGSQESDGSDGSESGEESDGSDETDGSHTSDGGDDNDGSEWREKADFAAIREAPPLSE